MSFLSWLKNNFSLFFFSIFWCNLKDGLLFVSDKIFFEFFFESQFLDSKNMKDQLSGQSKMLIVSYTAGHITLIYYSQVIMYLLI